MLRLSQHWPMHDQAQLGRKLFAFGPDQSGFYTRVFQMYHAMRGVSSFARVTRDSDLHI